MDLESSLFRILDEALGAYLAAAPDRVAIRLDWLDETVEARITASRQPTAAMANADREIADVAQASDAAQKDLPPALGAMLAERRERAEGAVLAAREAAIVSLPDAVWQLIQQRAITTGIKAELSEGGGDLRLLANIPGLSDAALEPA
jgi:hypothetical protein